MREIMAVDRPSGFRWPNGAGLAVSLVANTEEGPEPSVARGDERNESVYEVSEEVGGDPVHAAPRDRARGVPLRLLCLRRRATDRPTSSTAAVRDVMVEGRWVLCNGAFTMDDERDVLARIARSLAAAETFHAGHLPSGELISKPYDGRPA